MASGGVEHWCAFVVWPGLLQSLVGAIGGWK